MTVNIRRLALSAGIVGMIVLPLSTGAAKRAVPSGPIIGWDDDRDRFLERNDFMAPWICENLQIVTNPDTRRICTEAAAIPRANRVYSTSLKAERVMPLLGYLLLGFVVPFLIVLFAPKIARAYLRWVTTQPHRRPDP